VTAPPKPGYDYPDTKQFGYGLALPFVLVPLAAVGLVLALVSAVFERLAGGRYGTAANLLLTILAPAISQMKSPALWLARYNFHVIVAVLLIVAYCLGRKERFLDAIATLTCATGLMSLYWAEPAWFVNAKQLRHYMSMSARERATYSTIGWSIDHPAARARENELGPGDILAFSEDGEFYAILWNERFSNRVQFLPMSSAPAMMRALDSMGAKWFVTSRLTAAFDASPTWQRVGNVSGAPVVAFRRR
jgi:hypothetical protein